MARRIGTIENWRDINEVRLFGARSKVEPVTVAGTITLLDDEVEFNFPQTVVMTKEQAALIAAHIIALITQPTA